MKSDTVPETVVSTDLALQDFSAGGGELTQDEFVKRAYLAMEEAALDSGDAQAEFDASNKTIIVRNA